MASLDLLLVLPLKVCQIYWLTQIISPWKEIINIFELRQSEKRQYSNSDALLNEPRIINIDKFVMRATDQMLCESFPSNMEQKVFRTCTFCSVEKDIWKQETSQTTLPIFQPLKPASRNTAHP